MLLDFSSFKFIGGTFANLHQRIFPKSCTLYFSLLLLSLIALFSACSPERKLSESEFLLARNKVVADDKAAPIDKITYAILPRTNKRTLGFLTKVSIYQAMIPVERPHYEKFKRKMRNSLGQYPVLLDTVSNNHYINKIDSLKMWMQNTFGEPPVVLDSSLITYSLKQSDIIMRKSGYFDASTNYSVSFKGNQATVLYKITAGKPYHINDIQYAIADSVVAKIIYSDTSRSLIRRGDIYNEDVFENERSRIEERLLNRGYINFSRNNIRYEVDTNIGNRKLNLKVIIPNPRNKIDDSTSEEGKFRCYKIQSIDIYTDIPESSYDGYDTVSYSETVKNGNTNYYRIFFPKGTSPFRPFALVYPLFFKAGDVYSSRRTRQSYDRYIDMQNFGYVKINYNETEESKQQHWQDTGYLECKVQLQKLKQQSGNFDFLLKNTGGIFGAGGDFSYNNRNIFKAGEILSFSVKYYQEVQADSASILLFRNFEAGSRISLEIPRFVFPIKLQNLPKSFRPTTHASVGANYIKQDFYARFILFTNYSYRLNQRTKTGKLTTHSLTLVDFGLIKMYKDTLFYSMIEQYKFSQRTLQKYQDHFMLGTNYRYTLQKGNTYLFKAQFNSYGNILYGMMATANAEKDANQYVIWNMPFESFISADFDFIYNLIQKKHQMLIYHLTAGVGVPMFNSSVIPFEKSFYLGGSNSMRGWRLRSLGPGSYVDTSSNAIKYFERVGDIKFETNLEFRMPIYKYLHWAVFVDVGNIWLMKKNNDFPNGEFAFNRFYTELAIDAGFGLRLDLSFFVLRVDYALKIHDPAKKASNRWQTFKWGDYDHFKPDRVIMLGIGYPF